MGLLQDHLSSYYYLLRFAASSCELGVNQEEVYKVGQRENLDFTTPRVRHEHARRESEKCWRQKSNLK